MIAVIAVEYLAQRVDLVKRGNENSDFNEGREISTLCGDDFTNLTEYLLSLFNDA